MSAALLIWIIFPLSMVSVVYKRRVEKGMEEKQNTPADPRKLSLGSAGHGPLTGFWVGSSKNENLVWLYAMGLEKRRMTTLWDFGVHWDSVNSLQPWQFVPEKDPSHKLPDWHQCSGSASLGGQCLGSFSSSRQLSWHPEHTSSVRRCPDQRSGQDIRAHFKLQKRLCSHSQPAF